MKDKTEISVLYSSGGFQDGFFNPPSSPSRLCGRLTKHSDCPHGRPGDAEDGALIQSWLQLLVLCNVPGKKSKAFCILWFDFYIFILYFASHILYFVLSILHFAFYFLYFPFCVLHFAFCILHFVFSGCFLGRYDAAAKDEEADWRAWNHFWGVNVNLIRSTNRWKIFQVLLHILLKNFNCLFTISIGSRQAGPTVKLNHKKIKSWNLIVWPNFVCIFQNAFVNTPICCPSRYFFSVTINKMKSRFFPHDSSSCQPISKLISSILLFRASFLTGRYMHNTGAFNNSIVSIHI